MSNPKLKNILYAEDEPDIREIAKISLEEVGGFSVIYCRNGVEALELAKTTKPDLLLLDVMMPEMDGPTLLLELRKLPAYRNVPVIFMTAKIQPEELNKFKTVGAIDIITKPFDPMLLAQTIESIWERYQESCKQTS